MGVSENSTAQGLTSCPHLKYVGIGNKATKTHSIFAMRSLFWRAVSSFPTCVVAPRFASRSSILIEPPGRSYMCQASRCDASSSRAVMAFLASGPDQSHGLTVVRCCGMVFPKPTCDRLLHKSSENSPLSALDGMPLANSIPGSASGVDDQLPLVSFPLLSATSARGRQLIRLRA